MYEARPRVDSLAAGRRERRPRASQAGSPAEVAPNGRPTRRQVHDACGPPAYAPGKAGPASPRA